MSLEYELKRLIRYIDNMDDSEIAESLRGLAEKFEPTCKTCRGSGEYDMSPKLCRGICPDCRGTGREEK